MTTANEESHEEFLKRWDTAIATVQADPHFAKFSIAKYHAKRTSDGAFWTCLLVYEGRPAGELANEGYGGPDIVHISTPAARLSFDILKNLAAPVCTFEPESLVIDALLRVYEDRKAAERKAKRAAKKAAVRA